MWLEKDENFFLVHFRAIKNLHFLYKINSMWCFKWLNSMTHTYLCKENDSDTYFVEKRNEFWMTRLCTKKKFSTFPSHMTNLFFSAFLLGSKPQFHTPRSCTKKKFSFICHTWPSLIHKLFALKKGPPGNYCSSELSFLIIYPTKTAWIEKK